ncbi:uncharacterized protein [Asterias amurensis]|uniref:uncharacterized protein n=1 Tax=Asterias amurensis TaxID=7602 RepID=UPI003AB84C81
MVPVTSQPTPGYPDGSQKPPDDRPKVQPNDRQRIPPNDRPLEEPPDDQPKVPPDVWKKEPPDDLSSPDRRRAKPNNTKLDPVLISITAGVSQKDGNNNPVPRHDQKIQDVSKKEEKKQDHGDKDPECEFPSVTTADEYLISSPKIPRPQVCDGRQPPWYQQQSLEGRLGEGIMSVHSPHLPDVCHLGDRSLAVIGEQATDKKIKKLHELDSVEGVTIGYSKYVKYFGNGLNGRHVRPYTTWKGKKSHIRAPFILGDLIFYKAPNSCILKSVWNLQDLKLATRKIIDKQLSIWRNCNSSIASIVYSNEPYKATTDLERKIYLDFRAFNEKILSRNRNPVQMKDQWTMCTIKFAKEGKTTICVAFSGNKYRQEISQFWNENKFKYLKKNLNIVFIGKPKSHHKLAQNMVFLLLDIIEKPVIEDLKKLLNCILVGDDKGVQSIMNDRRDFGTIDYEDFIQHVNEEKKQFIHDIEKKIKEWAPTIFREGFGQRWLVHVIDPDRSDSEMARDLNPELLKILKGITRNKQQKLDKIPDEFFQKLKKALKQCHCAEDNAISSVLVAMLGQGDILDVSITALDKNNLNGKPFCYSCDKKVRIFSVLPSLLRHLDITSCNLRYLVELCSFYNSQWPAPSRKKKPY